MRNVGDKCTGEAWRRIMTNAKKSYRYRTIPDDVEITSTLAKADRIPREYFRLRVKALISMVKKFGKRRAEVGSLKLSDLEMKEGYLYVTFTLRKKHKRGLFQYIRTLQEHDATLLNKPFLEIQAEWKAWTHTEAGYTVKEERRTKRVNLEDKYARLIIEYVEWLRQNNPEGIYLFPSGKAVFSHYVILNERSLSGSQLLRLIKPLNRKLWLHLFREMKGAEIARELGGNITALTSVKQTLDLEREDTAYRYIERYAVQEMKPEIETKTA